MKIKVKTILLNDNAVIPFKHFDNDFCFDVVATDVKEVAKDVYRYGTGLAFQIERKWPFGGCLGYTDLEDMFKSYSLSIDFRPRSSIWKTGLVLSNCIGTIDEGYTGEVSAVFYHVVKELPIYNVGDRIGQIKIGFTIPVEFTVVEALDITQRNSGAYGSTGV